LRDKGHAAPVPSHRIRQDTVDPGATTAILSTSSSQSTAKCRTPRRYAASTSTRRLIVFPN
jgi:hypothetical protein